MNDKPYSSRSKTYRFPDRLQIPFANCIKIESTKSGRVFRTTFAEPITVTKDDVLESRWTKDGYIFTLNGVDIPSTTEKIK